MVIAIMKLVDYIRRKNISYRDRAIALSLVGGIFFILLCFSLWQQYFVDGLIKYAPEDTVVYAHFSLPKSNSSNKFDSLVLQVLKDNNLEGLPLVEIKRELAVVGQIKNNNLLFSILIKVNNPSRLKKILSDNEIKYQSLSYNTILIPASYEIASDFIKNKENIIIQKTNNKFSRFNSLSIYVSSVLTGQIQNSLLPLASQLMSEEGNLFLNVQSKRDGLRIFSSRDAQKEKISKSEKEKVLDFDLVLSSDNFSNIIFNFETRLKSLGSDNFLIWQEYLNLFVVDDNIDNLLDSPSLLLVKHTSDGGWFFKDNEFLLIIDLNGNELTEAQQEKLEEVIKNIVAQEFPIKKPIYLLGGGRIYEFVADPSQFEFNTQENIRILVTPDENVGFMYKIQDNRLIVSNSQDLLDNLVIFSGNYVKIGRNLMPNGGLWDYLHNWGYVELERDFIGLK